MNGDIDLLMYNIKGLFGGMYDPLCRLVPPDAALEMLFHDFATASFYVVIPVVLLLGWRFFMWLEYLGYLMIAYAVFIFFCGLNHVSGQMMELGGYFYVDVWTARLTTISGFVAAVLTAAWAGKVKGPLKNLGDAVKATKQSAETPT